MFGNPRGNALIINVKNVKGCKPRDGTDKDRDALKELWEGLYFNTIVYNDSDGLTAKVRNDHF